MKRFTFWFKGGREGFYVDVEHAFVYMLSSESVCVCCIKSFTIVLRSRKTRHKSWYTVISVWASYMIRQLYLKIWYWIASLLSQAFSSQYLAWDKASLKYKTINKYKFLCIFGSTIFHSFHYHNVHVISSLILYTQTIKNRHIELILEFTDRLSPYTYWKWPLERWNESLFPSFSALNPIRAVQLSQLHPLKISKYDCLIINGMNYSYGLKSHTILCQTPTVINSFNHMNSKADFTNVIITE